MEVILRLCYDLLSAYVSSFVIQECLLYAEKASLGFVADVIDRVTSRNMTDSDHHSKRTSYDTFCCQVVIGLTT